jgi:hypothetical protein
VKIGTDLNTGGSMKKERTHVVPSTRGNWSIRKEGSGRAEKVFDTKHDAITYGREVAKRLGVDLVIHGRDGRIQDIDTYSNDPNPPRDKKH